MLYTQTIVLALVAAATAIDVRFYSSGNCGGSYTTCSGAKPGECCRGPAQRFSVEFAAIPKDWKIRGTSYNGHSPCRFPNQGADSAGRSSICLVSRAENNSARYEFISKKRGDDGSLAQDGIPAAVEGAAEQKCIRPDTLVLEDGTAFDLTNLNEAAFDTMCVSVYVSASGSAATVSDVPEEFLPYIV
ncbi:hypothetical protein Micbo1qcDRAFT_178546 [Microdochium bolleyi]|uniref:Uncharacterized protein n=1 Tax=Microdochium bolleyi TaxID=196109 RepID=A0A136ISN3_9PEZI|nr:hypothetical protein Micbo1qcDRAFT_178546 [Microdochium bolleyi]